MTACLVEYIEDSLKPAINGSSCLKFDYAESGNPLPTLGVGFTDSGQIPYSVRREDFMSEE